MLFSEHRKALTAHLRTKMLAPGFEPGSSPRKGEMMDRTTPCERCCCVTGSVHNRFGHSSSSSPDHQRFEYHKVGMARINSGINTHSYPIKSSISSPNIEISIVNIPNLSPLPNNPASRNGRKSILPIPAIQENTLYGMGDAAAMNIPSVPCRFSNASNLLALFSEANLSSRGLPALTPR